MNTCILFVILLSSPALFSQELPEIETDRPDQTECSSVIPQKTFQIETGYFFEKAGNYFTHYFPTTLFRFGLFQNAELRIIAGEYSISEYKTDTFYLRSENFSPFSIGTKIHICDEKGILPQCCFIAHLSHDNAPFSANNIVPDFRFSMSHTLTEKIDIGYNLGGEWEKAANSFRWIYTLTTAFALSEKFGMYLEAFGNVAEGTLPKHRFDAGFTFLAKNNFQLDCSGGFALNENSPDYFLSFGFGWRVPK